MLKIRERCVLDCHCVGPDRFMPRMDNKDANRYPQFHPFVSILKGDDETNRANAMHVENWLNYISANSFVLSWGQRRIIDGRSAFVRGFGIFSFLDFEGYKYSVCQSFNFLPLLLKQFLWGRNEYLKICQFPEQDIQYWANCKLWGCCVCSQSIGKDF